MTQIPYTDFGGTGETILILHANGFPPKAYQKLIDQLTKSYHVLGMEQRPLWPNADANELRSWDLFTADLIAFIEFHKLGPVKCIGHSLGAIVSVLASYKRPDLFQQLVLIEPVLFSWPIPFLARLFPPAFSRNVIPISRIALKRRNKWPSRAEMYQSYRQKKIFSRINYLVLTDLVEAATYEDAQGEFRLRFPKLWEAQIYATVVYIIDKIISSSIPISVARGEHTDVISNKVWIKIKANLPQQNLLNVEDSSHLLPLEKPELIGEWILGQFKFK